MAKIQTGMVFFHPIIYNIVDSLIITLELRID